MIKKSFRLMLLVAFALSSVMFVACNKYDDDIERIDGELAALNATVQTLKAAVDGGAVISSVSNTADGVKFTLSNGQSYVVNHGTVGKDGANGADGKDGQDGKPGSVVTIGENGNWHIDGVDQGVSATGASTFVVDCGSYYELNVLEKVEGENAEIVKINLPKTQAITDIQSASVDASGRLIPGNYSPRTVVLSYGSPLAAEVKFNGTTYAKGTSLVGVGATLSAIVNPMDADASVYSFVLEDSKGNAPYVLGTATPNMTEKPLTRAAKSPNKGVWDMTVNFAEGVKFDEKSVAARSNIAYAISTVSHLGKVASGYDVKVRETPISTLETIAFFQGINDKKTRVVDLDTCFKRPIFIDEDGRLWSDGSDYTNYVVARYYEFKDKTKAASMGAELNDGILSATKHGNLEVCVNYLLADGSKVEDNSVTVTVNFEYIVPTGDALGSYTWTVQKDDGVKDNGVETEYYYLPISAVKANLIAGADDQLPKVYCSAITWADGDELNDKFFAVNGTYYGTKPSGSTVTATPVAIDESDIATVDATPYVYDAKNKKYVAATDINDELYVKVNFNSQKAIVGDYVLTLDFMKWPSTSPTSNPAISVPFNLSIVAPENVIVKNEPYFAGDNAVVYGVADGTKVTADLDDLFTTTGLSYTVTQIKKTSDSKKADFYPFGANTDGVVVNGAITVPVKATGNANYCVGTTQEFTASKTLFPRVAAATYTFNVTVTSPVVITYTGAAKTINEDPITIAVDEFTGKSLKTGDALYIGKIVADKTYNVDPNHIPANGVTVGVKADDYAKYVKISDGHTTFAEGTVTRKDAEGKVVSTVDAIQVERVAGIAQQSPVTCTVNVTVKDLWGVSHVIPVAVTVNPLQ